MERARSKSTVKRVGGVMFLVYLAVQVSGVILGGAALLLPELLDGGPLGASVFTEVPMVLLVGVMITSLPTAIYAVVLTLIGRQCLRRWPSTGWVYLVAAVLIVLIWLVVGSLFGVLRYMDEEMWYLVGASVMAGFVGASVVVVLLRPGREAWGR